MCILLISFVNDWLSTKFLAYPAKRTNNEIIFKINCVMNIRETSNVCEWLAYMRRRPYTAFVVALTFRIPSTAFAARSVASHLTFNISSKLIDIIKLKSQRHDNESLTLAFENSLHQVAFRDNRNGRINNLKWTLENDGDAIKEMNEKHISRKMFVCMRHQCLRFIATGQ